MRRGFGFIGLVLTTILLVVVGVVAYQAGWSEGFAQHVPEGTAVAGPYPYYPYYGPHFFGFGWIFGLLFFLFLIFIVSRIARFGRWGYGGGWGGGYRKWGQGGVPPAIEERMREWHQRAHGEQPAAGGQAPPPPPPSQTV